jgi:hypothetical protein
LPAAEGFATASTDTDHRASSGRTSSVSFPATSWDLLRSLRPFVSLYPRCPSSDWRRDPTTVGAGRRCPRHASTRGDPRESRRPAMLAQANAICPWSPESSRSCRFDALKIRRSPITQTWRSRGWSGRQSGLQHSPQRSRGRRAAASDSVDVTGSAVSRSFVRSADERDDDAGRQRSDSTNLIDYCTAADSRPCRTMGAVALSGRRQHRA